METTGELRRGGGCDWLGAAVLDMLRKRGFAECRVVPVMFTSGERETFNIDGWHVPKRDLVQGLAVLLEMGGLRLAGRIYLEGDGSMTI